MKLLLQVIIFSYFSVAVIFSGTESDYEVEQYDEPENLTCHMVDKTFKYEESGFPPRKCVANFLV